MEMPVGDHGGGYTGVVDWKREEDSASYPGIRLFTVQNTVAAAPAKDCKGSWSECSPKSVHGFSATAYFFGRALHKELGVPIGLISADWGGTPAQSWVSAAGLKVVPEFGGAVAQLADWAKDPAAAEKRGALAMDEWWTSVEKVSDAAKEPAAAKGTDVSTWGSIQTPGLWQGDLAKFDGAVWLRRTVEIPAEMAGKELKLELGAIDDMDSTFWDGERIGTMHGPSDYATARSYTIPKERATAGEHVLAIMVVDRMGPGGLSGGPEAVKISAGGKSVPLAGQWKFRAGPPLTVIPKAPAMFRPDAWTASALYNGMIAPIANYGIRGAIWYQGESNRGQPEQYSRLMPALISDWRRAFGREIPFYFVQIAPFKYDGSGLTGALREAQYKTLAVPGTGMAVTTDIGDVDDIHPRNKQEVGRRLSLWALAKTYGKTDVVCSGPLLASVSGRDGAIRLRFEYGDGLSFAGGKAKGFQIAGADKKFVDADVRIEGNDVVVSSARVSAPVAVRYGWADAPECTLVNGAGLPASPFRTDSW